MGLIIPEIRRLYVHRRSEPARLQSIFHEQEIRITLLPLRRVFCSLRSGCFFLQQPDLGLSKEDWDVLTAQTTIVFNCAASVRFNEDLDAALRNNVASTLEMVRFSKACKNIMGLLHVSTAYVQADRPSTIFILLIQSLIYSFVF